VLIAGAASDERFRADAFGAAWAADHDRALASLHNAPWLGSNVMRARVYGQKGLLDRALVELRRASELRSDREETAELAMIAATLLGARGRRVEAILALHEAEILVDELADRALQAQYRLAVAQVELSNGNTSDARAALDAALDLTETLVDGAQLRDYRLEVNHIRARLFELRAQILALDYDYAAQLDDLCRAIATAKLVRHRDLWHEAGLLASISSVIGTFPKRSARLLLASASADVRWNSHLDSREMAIRFNIARSEMLFGAGDDLAAFSGRGAPSLAARLALDTDRLFFDEWRDPQQYERELDFASSLAENVEWNNVTGEEILGLVTLALLLAPYDLTRALAIKSLYDLMLTKLSREAQGFLEPRRVAFDDFASACLAKAQGDTATARETLDDCIAFWSARGMDPWWAIASLERFPISQDPADLEPARRFIDVHPRSRFSARLATTLAIAGREPRRSFPYLREVGASG
jgi:hypothetical protein